MARSSAKGLCSSRTSASAPGSASFSASAPMRAISASQPSRWKGGTPAFSARWTCARHSASTGHRAGFSVTAMSGSSHGAWPAASSAEETVSPSRSSRDTSCSVSSVSSTNPSLARLISTYSIARSDIMLAESSTAITLSRVSPCARYTVELQAWSIWRRSSSSTAKRSARPECVRTSIRTPAIRSTVARSPLISPRRRRLRVQTISSPARSGSGRDSQSERLRAALPEGANARVSPRRSSRTPSSPVPTTVQASPSRRPYTSRLATTTSPGR